MIYTGIGSRETPPDIITGMYNFGRAMALSGAILRSGKAGGADEAFELGHLSVGTTHMEIYIPWYNFKNPNIRFDKCDIIGGNHNDTWYTAQQMALSVHPNPRALKGGALALHTRNVYQVLGLDLNIPSDFVIFYANVDHYGKVKGGTATAVNIATQNHIPTYNIATDIGDSNVRKLWNHFRE